MLGSGKSDFAAYLAAVDLSSSVETKRLGADIEFDTSIISKLLKNKCNLFYQV